MFCVLDAVFISEAEKKQSDKKLSQWGWDSCSTMREEQTGFFFF